MFEIAIVLAVMIDQFSAQYYRDEYNTLRFLDRTVAES